MTRQEEIDLAINLISQISKKYPDCEYHAIENGDYLIVGNLHLIYVTNLITMDTYCFIPKTKEILPEEVVLYQNIFDFAKKKLSEYALNTMI